MVTTTEGQGETDWARTLLGTLQLKDGGERKPELKYASQIKLRPKGAVTKGSNLCKTISVSIGVGEAEDGAIQIRTEVNYFHYLILMVEGRIYIPDACVNISRVQLVESVNQGPHGSFLVWKIHTHISP